MKVLDESGVKKIVKDYKTADTNIKNNITQINSFLDHVEQTYDPTDCGFALYGLSNKEDSLIIPIDETHLCFTVEGTESPILGKIYAGMMCAVFVNGLSKAVMVDKFATFHDVNGQLCLIIEQDSENPVLIKPVINVNGTYLPDDNITSVQLVKEKYTYEIAEKYGDGNYNSFTYDEFSDYKS